MCPFSYYPPIYVQVSQMVSPLHIFELKCCMHLSSLPCRLQDPSISSSFLFYHHIWWGVQITKHLIMQISLPSYYFLSFLELNISHSRPLQTTTSLSHPKFRMHTKQQFWYEWHYSSDSICFSLRWGIIFWLLHHTVVQKPYRRHYLINNCNENQKIYS